MNKASFELLKSINAPSYELALVVPVLLDLKPASTIALSEGDEDTHEVDKKLQSIGLLTQIDIRDEKPRFHQIHLAKTRENLEKVLVSDENYSRGIAYGYPKSAVEAAKNGTASRINKESQRFIIQFSTSPKNHEQEIKLMKSWDEAIRIHTPKIYQEFQQLTFHN